MLPHLDPTSIAYASRQLARLAGLPDTRIGNGFEPLSLPVHYVPLEEAAQHSGLILVRAPQEQWHTLLSKEPPELRWLDPRCLLPPGASLPFEGPLPVLFGAETAPIELRPDNSLLVRVDLLATILFLLTQWEEQNLPVRDEHGRFPAHASVAARQGFLDQPILDRYALLLQAWLRRVRPRWRAKPTRFAVCLTHDVDFVQHFVGAGEMGRELVRGVVRQRSLNYVRQVAHQAIIQTVRPEQDSYWRGVYDLARISEENGLRSTFFFMAAERSHYDNGYDPMMPRVRRALKQLRMRGHKIGFHPGYHTAYDSGRFKAEKARLEAALGEPICVGRQHFLRFEAPTTWKLGEAAGLECDSSLGYSDHEGFRAGSCHPFRPFDWQERRELEIQELPLIVMDATLRNYRALSPKKGRARILELAQRCVEVGGTFTLLWHNSSMQEAWQSWGEMYRQTIPHLAQMEQQQ